MIYYKRNTHMLVIFVKIITKLFRYTIDIFEIQVS